MRALLIFAALALSGCATTRYTTVYCLTQAQLEQLKSAKPGKVHSQLTGQADKDLKLVAGRLVRVEAYADGLIEVLGGCVDPGGQSK
jgi:outer membrane lipoprotein SlyB